MKHDDDGLPNGAAFYDEEELGIVRVKLAFGLCEILHKNVRVKEIHTIYCISCLLTHIF